MSDFLRELLIIYGSTTISSIIFNSYYFNKKNKIAFDQSKRKLKYKDLSLKSNIALENLKESYKIANKLCLILSTIPIYQLFHTARNITSSQEEYNIIYDEEIDIINKEELLERKKFLKQLKKLNVIPDDIKEKLEDENYLPSESELKKVLILNKPKTIINNKNLKIIRRTPESDE